MYMCICVYIYIYIYVCMFICLYAARMPVAAADGLEEEGRCRAHLPIDYVRICLFMCFVCLLRL